MESPQCSQSNDRGRGGTEDADVFRVAFSGGAKFVGDVASRAADAVFVGAAKDDSSHVRKRWRAAIMAFGKFVLSESNEVMHGGKLHGGVVG